MKITLPHLPEVTIFVILLGQCFIVGCDEQDRRAELSETNVHGEANLEYLDKPGLFGSKGVQLSLENFSLAEGIDKTYVLRNIPATKQPYRLLFLSDTRLGNGLSSNLQITTTLEDSSGKLYWSVVSVRRNTSTDIATAEASCLAKGRTGHGTGKGGGRARSAA